MLHTIMQQSVSYINSREAHLFVSTTLATYRVYNVNDMQKTIPVGDELKLFNFLHEKSSFFYRLKEI